MRHRRTNKKLSRSQAQRKALINAMLRAVVLEERIMTTQAKAKYLRSWVDKLINWGKEDSLHYRRLSFRYLKDHNLVKRLFDVIGPRFKDISGGYCRIINVGYRQGDGAKMAILELTKKEKKIKKDDKQKSKKEHAVKEEKKEMKHPPKKTFAPKKDIISGIKNIFKKERDAL